MSKKILKRSLALGALMAFVITGSAYAMSMGPKFDAAAEGSSADNRRILAVDIVNIGNDKPGGLMNIWTEEIGLYTSGQWKDYPISGTFANVNHCNEKFWDVKDNEINIISKKYDVDHPGYGIYVKGFNIIGSESSRIVIDAEKYGILGYGVIGESKENKIGTLDIKSGDVGILHNDSKSTGLAIYTSNLYIDAGDDAIQLTKSTSTISADVLKITNAGGRAIRIGGGTHLIEAKELNIDGATEVSKISDGTLTLIADAGTIKNDFYVTNKGKVGMTLKSGVNWTGKFVTENNGSLDLSGTWNLKEVFANDRDVAGKANSLTEATFRNGSTFVIEGKDFDVNKGSTTYALNGVGDKATLTVESGAKLKINGITETTHNIAKGFTNLEGAVDKWEVSDINALMQGVAWTTKDGLQVTVTAKETDQMAADTGMSTSTAGLVQSIIENAKTADTPAEKAAVEFIEKVQANNSTPEAVGNAINNATKMGEAGGNSATAASIVKNVTGVTNDRLSFNCGHSAPHKGGHGVGLFEEGSGADVWVEYVHGKDEVEDMPSTAGASSYEGQYNGIVMGVDFKKVNKFQSGIAFNYGEGDTNSVGNAVRTHSDYDFWGVGYYGSIHNDDSNVIFDISYAQTDSDVTQNNSGTAFEANPETTTWSAGVKLEKLYQNENVQIVPYTGLRYMSIDADDYSTRNGEFYYSMDRQDIWLLPLGVSIKQEVTNDNGWTVSPRVDLSYIWAFGDTNSNMEVKSPFAGVSQLGYDVMDDGSFLGLVGIEAHKGQWGYGVAYSYQKGDHSESKKWYVDVNYSF